MEAQTMKVSQVKTMLPIVAEWKSDSERNSDLDLMSFR